MMTVVLIVAFLILLLIGVPVAIAMGLAALIALLFGSDVPLIILVQKAFTSIDTFTLMAIPFFILAGTIMTYGGISRRLIAFANAYVGHIKGGLGMVAVLASLIFAAISGSGPATVAALGAILIPAMIERGYKPGHAAGIQASAGSLGVILPPSITMILFGVATGTSIGDLFIAGIIPGIIVGLSLMVVVYILAKKHDYPSEEKTDAKTRLKVTKDAFFALLMPIIVLGGIYGGIFTPTEASVVAVAYSFIIGLVIYKEIKIKDLYKILKESAITSTTVMFILANAGIFSWILTVEGSVQAMADFMTSISSNVFLFLIIINLFLIIIGMFLEGAAAMVILAPLLTPIAVQFGIDPVHFGIIMVLNLSLGLFTPPLGVNLFIASPLAGVSLEKVSRGVMPFIAVMLLNIIIISFIPSLSIGILEFMD